MLNYVRDLLIFEAYFSLSPVASVDFCFYEPAKSTKFNFADFIEKVLSSFSYLVCTLIVRIECDLEDY
jgi:hypothetical protein